MKEQMSGWMNGWVSLVSCLYWMRIWMDRLPCVRFSFSLSVLLLFWNIWLINEIETRNLFCKVFFLCSIYYRLHKFCWLKQLAVINFNWCQLKSRQQEKKKIRIYSSTVMKGRVGRYIAVPPINNPFDDLLLAQWVF